MPSRAQNTVSQAGVEVDSQFRQITLDKFLRVLGDDVRVLTEGNRQATLRWVEPSELADPAPYLMPGELILTAGLPFLDEAGPGEVDAYVRRLVAAEVCAVGFGLAPYHAQVPAELVAACAAHHVLLLAIPPSLPFAEIGLRFAQLLESESAAIFRQLTEANRRLLRAVLSPRPEHELLAVLTRSVPGAAVLVGPDSRLRARAGTPAIPITELAPLLGRLYAGTGPRVELAHLADAEHTPLVAHPLRSLKDDNLGALVLAPIKPLTAIDHNILSAAVGLLELLSRQRRSGSLAPGQLATRLLLGDGDGDGDGATRAETSASSASSHELRELLAQSVGAARTSPVRVVLGFPMAPSPPTSVRELLLWRQVLETTLVHGSEDGFTAITRLRVDDAVVATAQEAGWNLVIGEAVEPPQLPRSLARAQALLPRARSSKLTLRVEDEPPTVTGLLGHAAGSALAQELLAPLLRLDGKRRESLLNILRVWLTHHGSWDATAKALNLHRNSVRRHIGVLTELLGQDLNEARTRAELLIALDYVSY